MTGRAVTGWAARVAAAAALAGAIIAVADVFGPTPAAVVSTTLRATLAQAVASRPGATVQVDDPHGLCRESAAATMSAVAPTALDTSVLPMHFRCDRDGLGVALRDADGKTLVSAQPYGAASMLGPLLAVLLVVLLRRPATALVAAVVVAMSALHPPWQAATRLGTIVADTLFGADNQMILLFTVAMLGMVQVGLDSGAYAALARWLAGHAARPSARRVRVATAGLGLAIFFDDYASCLVTGGSMRHACDHAGVSREKLSYLVDATAASVAGVALVSTWVGFEVGILGEFGTLFAAVAASPYAIFLAVLPYRFYCMLTIIAAPLLAWTGWDFGPMRAAEARAARQRAADEALAVPSTAPPQPQRGWLALLPALVPVGLVLAPVVIGNLWAGRAQLDQGVAAAFVAGANLIGMRALGLGGVLGLLAAVGLALRSGHGLVASLRSAAHGVRHMLPVLALLVAAMSMRAVSDEAGTSRWLAALLGGGASGPWLPVTCFGVAALVGFLTGSSWATMGILLPVVLPLAAADQGPVALLLAASAAVLDGAIFGDHCSPLSDTTVMSSAAAGVAHDAHVNTQMPYAVVVMLIAATCGYIGVGVGGLGAVAALALGVVTLVATLALLARLGAAKTALVALAALGCVAGAGCARPLDAEAPTLPAPTELPPLPAEPVAPALAARAEARATQGLAALAKGDLAAARTMLTEACQLDPSSTDARLGLTRTYLAAGRGRAALALLEPLAAAGADCGVCVEALEAARAEPALAPLLTHPEAAAVAAAVATAQLPRARQAADAAAALAQARPGALMAMAHPEVPFTLVRSCPGCPNPARRVPEERTLQGFPLLAKVASRFDTRNPVLGGIPLLHGGEPRCAGRCCQWQVPSPVAVGTAALAEVCLRPITRDRAALTRIVLIYGPGRGGASAAVGPAAAVTPAGR